MIVAFKNGQIQIKMKMKNKLLMDQTVYLIENKVLYYRRSGDRNYSRLALMNSAIIHLYLSFVIVSAFLLF